MEIFIWKLINKIMAVIFVVILIISYLFFLLKTYDNINNYNSIIKGRIIERYVNSSNSPGIERFTKYGYKILSKNDTLLSTSSLKKPYNINDSIEGYMVGDHSVKIIKVNNKKVSSRFGIVDLISLVVTITVPVLIYRLIRNKIKK